MEEFDKKIVREYLRYGSVDEVLARQELPISKAGYHRVLDKWGVVKSAGPNNRLSEVVEFVERLTIDKLPLAKVYRKLPPSFQTSAMTLHRVLSYVKRGVTRREATVLVITSSDGPKQVLMGKDVASPKLKYGQRYGAFSLPMTFSKKGEEAAVSVKRVLQHEVLSRQTEEGNFPEEVIPRDIKPFLLFDVADIRLKVYKVELPRGIELGDFNSEKLAEYKFFGVDEVCDEMKFRTGVVQIVGCYIKWLASGQLLPVVLTSGVNQKLVALERA